MTRALALIGIPFYITQNRLSYTYDHDIALVDQGDTRTTFGCVLILQNNDVLYYFCIKVVLGPTFFILGIYTTYNRSIIGEIFTLENIA